MIDEGPPWPFWPLRVVALMVLFGATRFLKVSESFCWHLPVLSSVFMCMALMLGFYIA